MPYPIPPWLSNQPSPTEEYTRGVQLGAQVAQQRQQLAAQREQAAMSAAVRQQELEQDSIRQQQNLLMTKAYHDAQVGLRERELDQQQQQIQMRTQQAARKAAAQMVYTRRVQAGEDAAKVLLEMGPELGESLVGSAQLYKATQPQAPLPPPGVREFGGQKWLEIPQRTGASRFQQIKETPELAPGAIQGRDVLDASGRRIPGLIGTPTASGGLTVHVVPDRQVRVAMAQLARLDKADIGWNLRNDTEPEAESMKKIYRKLKPEYDRLQKIVAEGGTPESPGPAAPTPAGKGKVYTDASGKRWRYIGTNSNPKSDRNEANWVEEEETR